MEQECTGSFVLRAFKGGDFTVYRRSQERILGHYSLAFLAHLFRVRDSTELVASRAGGH